MNNSTTFDRLDQAIDQIIADRRPELAPAESAIAELLEIASDLRHLPRAEFKMRLRAELLEGPIAVTTAAGDNHCQSLSENFAVDGDVLPTLTGQGPGMYPVRPANFATSVGLHVALLSLLGLGLVLAKNAPRVLDLRDNATPISIYVPLHGGGGGGEAGKLDASKGPRPRLTAEQLAPPVVVTTQHQPKLTVDPSLIGTPKLTVPENTRIGDPLSALVTPSGGPGVRSGIGTGSSGGDGPGTGPGLGPGSLGSSGEGVFSTGHGVTAPRAIYSPDPAYSDEARKAKYQGTVGLWAVVGADGRPRDIWVSNSVGMGLDENAVAAVRTWRFEPGTKDGRPVTVQVYIEVNFRLF